MIKRRLSECRLELHPEKTKIVYWKDDKRPGRYPSETFDFLGFTFRPRFCKSRDGRYLAGFLPAISDKAAKEIRREMRSWRLHLRSDKSLEDLSRICNPILRGWIDYYGQYCQSVLYRIFSVFDGIVMR